MAGFERLVPSGERPALHVRTLSHVIVSNLSHFGKLNHFGDLSHFGRLSFFGACAQLAPILCEIGAIGAVRHGNPMFISQKVLIKSFCFAGLCGTASISHPYTHAHSHIHTHTHSLSHTLTHTHSHTHTLTHSTVRDSLYYITQKRTARFTVYDPKPKSLRPYLQGYLAHKKQRHPRTLQ